MNSLNVKLILQAVDRMTAPIRSMSNRLRGYFSSINQSITAVGKKTAELGKSMQRVGGAMSARLTTTIGGLGFMAVRTSAQFEDFRANLETATGSVENADAAWNMLTKFAETTPYELTEVMGAFIKLKNLGLDPTAEAMRSYGNTASAMGKGLDQYIEAIADATTFEFERLKEFGIKTRQNGERIAFTFQGQTKVIRKNAEEIERYLRAIGDERFAGSMEKRMRGLNGILSNFQDTLSSVLSDFGDDIVKELDIKGIIRDAAQSIQSLFEAFKALSPELQRFLIWAGLILTVIGPVIIAFGQLVLGIGFAMLGFAKFGTGIAIISGFLYKTLIPALWGATLAVARLGLAFMATPIGWITAAIAALAVAGYLIITNWEVVKEFWGNLWNGLSQVVADAVQFMRPLIDWVSGAMNKVIDAGSAVGSFVSDNAVTRGISGLFGGGGSTQTIAPVAASPWKQQNLNAGGTLNIKIDTEGRPSVVRSKPADDRMRFNVDTGLIMGGAY